MSDDGIISRPISFPPKDSTPTTTPHQPPAPAHSEPSSTSGTIETSASTITSLAGVATQSTFTSQTTTFFSPATTFFSPATTFISPTTTFTSQTTTLTSQTTTLTSQTTTISQSSNAITSSTSSHTTTAPTSVPTTILMFKLPSAFIACSSSPINWNYTGEPTSVKLTLMVDNHFPQDVPPPHFINKTLSSQIDPTSGSFLWPSVNIPQGWYRLHSSLPLYDQVNQTSMFYVEEGTDTSCFITSTVTGRTHIGAIAGGIAGGIALMIGLCIACLYVYCRPRDQSSIALRIKEMVAHLRPTYFNSVASAHPDIPPNSQKIPGGEINASDSDSPHGHSPRSTVFAPDGPSYPKRAVASTYSRSDSSLGTLVSYPNPFIDGHFTPNHTLSYAGSHLSPRSSSWSFTAVSQLNAGASAVDTTPYSTQDAVGSDHLTFSTSSTALPLYRSPTTTSTLPPSFHTSEQSTRNIEHLLASLTRIYTENTPPAYHTLQT